MGETECLIRLFMLCLTINPLGTSQAENGLEINYKTFVQRVNVDDSSLFAMGGSASYWQNPRGITVCWETAGYEREKEFVRSAIAETWEAFSALRFVGWTDCVSSVSYDIRIVIADKWPRVRAFGSNLKNLRNGMVLNFEYEYWERASCSWRKDWCTRGIAVHEFGHAIGLAHEQNRPDAPLWCSDAERNGPPEDHLITIYDPHSIMNYCNAKYNNLGRLSELDKQAVQLIYPSGEPSTARNMIWIVNWDPEKPGLQYDTETGMSTLHKDNFGYDVQMFLPHPATSSCNRKIYTSINKKIIIWDSVTKTSETLDNLLLTRRTEHSMDCVNEGKDLLICGGRDPDSGYRHLKSCELCHMSAARPVCVSYSDMPAARLHHTSVTVNDNRVLIIGGTEIDDKGLKHFSSVFSYDVGLDAWSELPSMLEARGDYPGAAMLDAYRLLVCGGYDRRGRGSNFVNVYHASCEMLNLRFPDRGWTKMAYMQQKRAQFAMVPMDGGLYALGGWGEGRLSSVEVFNSATLKWSYAKNMSQSINTFTAVRL